MRDLVGTLKRAGAFSQCTPTLFLVFSSTVRERVELVFHGLNPEDPSRKIEAFRRIMESSGTKWNVVFDPGQGGSVPGSSSYYQWISVIRRK